MYPLFFVPKPLFFTPCMMREDAIDCTTNKHPDLMLLSLCTYTTC